MSILYVYGIAYTPAYEKDYSGTYLSYRDMNDKLVQQCIGLPVFINHDTASPRVGEVVDANITPELHLAVLLKLDIPYFNSLIYNGLTSENATGNQYFRGLSMGLRVGEAETTYYTHITSKVPMEISIVPEGDRPNCDIISFYMV